MSLPSFYSLHKRRAVISAVDLLKGMAIYREWKLLMWRVLREPYLLIMRGKANATIDALKRGLDFVFLHVEASDECGHQKDLKGKIQAIENLDFKLLQPIL